VDKAVGAVWSFTGMGPDGIHAGMIKHLGPKGKSIIHWLFNTSMEIGYLPSDWRIARTVLIKKKNANPNDPTTFRPIAITSVVARMLEKLIMFRIKSNETIDEQFHKHQFGFRSKRSTIDAITRTVSIINRNWNAKRSIPMIFLDLKKAYDTVDHNILLKKVWDFRLEGYMKVWIKATDNFMSVAMA
jgi:retron-type reverse transcriptase